MNTIKFLSIISPIVSLLILVSVVGGFICLLQVAEKPKHGKFAFRFAVLFLAMLAINILETYVLKKHLLAACEDSSAHVSVSIDNRELLDSRKFICFLASFREFKGRSGSHPTTEANVRVSYDGVLDFTLKKDSRDADDYWVFYPGYLFMAEIGFVSTHLESWSKKALQNDG